MNNKHIEKVLKQSTYINVYNFYYNKIARFNFSDWCYVAKNVNNVAAQTTGHLIQTLRIYLEDWIENEQ